MSVENVVILGSGPAGSTAAIYLARAGFDPLVLEGTQPGGQLTITTEVENFPGFPEGIQGPELMAKMKEQAEKFGARYEFDRVVEADLSKRPFTLKMENTDTPIQTQALIIASGASAMYLGLESEKRLMGHGVSACATCDGFFFKNKEIAVVGGGDTALEEASFLTRFATKVTIIHRRDALRASKPMQDRALANPRITVLWDSVVVEVLGTEEKGVSGLKIKNVKTGALSELPVQGLFLGIGHTPNTQPFAGKLTMNEKGYLTTHAGTHTSTEGVFACGDVQDAIYRQAITAAGTGCMAALDCQKFLEEHAK
jgi:thioredoxin reductase (NADPH)